MNDQNTPIRKKERTTEENTAEENVGFIGFYPRCSFGKKGI